MNVLLVAIDAKFIHKSIAVWYLKSYCDRFSDHTVSVFEATVNENRDAILQNILSFNAEVIGFSCYIWNIELIRWLCEKMKEAMPTTQIVCGGPEMEDATCAENGNMDTIIVGSGEKTFLWVLDQLKNKLPMQKIVVGEPIKLAEVPSPYTSDFFNSISGNKRELKSKLIYYESSRGCPFSCAYCLSGKSQKVDYLSVERVQQDLSAFLEHGFCTIKFIDRTFNADKNRAYRILAFIQALHTDATFHFEVSADLFDDRTIALIHSMPPKRVQFEIGVQSTNPKVLAAVNRKADVQKILSRSAEIIKAQNAQVHIDLIAGLPYEDMASLIASFNACMAIRPHKLQLGFLKLLKGSPIRADSQTHGYCYDSMPPYEVIGNAYISREQLLVLKKIEDVLNKFYNKPMFYHSVRYLLDSIFAENTFLFFSQFAEFLGDKNAATLQLKQSYTVLYEFMCLKMDKALAAHWIKLDSFRFDPKNVLPDGISLQRNKSLQQEFLNTHTQYKRVKVEYFDYLNKHIVFLYDQKEGVYGLYPYKVI